jgi:hypothetical protein
MTGVVSIVFSFSVLALFFESIRPRLTQAKIEIRLLKLEREYLIADIEQATGKAAEGLTVRALPPDQRVKLKEIQAREIRLDETLNEANWLTDLMRSGMVFIVVGALGGCLLAMMGFGLWYNQTQKYQDEMLRIEAGSAKAKAVAPTPEAAEGG